MFFGKLLRVLLSLVGVVAFFRFGQKVGQHKENKETEDQKKRRG